MDRAKFIVGKSVAVWPEKKRVDEVIVRMRPFHTRLKIYVARPGGFIECLGQHTIYFLNINYSYTINICASGVIELFAIDKYLMFVFETFFQYA